MATVAHRQIIAVDQYAAKVSLRSLKRGFFVQYKDDLLVSSHKWALASGRRASVQGRECDSEFRTQCHMRLRQRLHKINFWSQLSMVSGDKSLTPAVDLRVWQLSATYYMKHGSHTHTHRSETDPHEEISPAPLLRSRLQSNRCSFPPWPCMSSSTFSSLHTSRCLCDLLLFDASLTFPSFHLELSTGGDESENKQSLGFGTPSSAILAEMQAHGNKDSLCVHLQMHT